MKNLFYKALIHILLPLLLFCLISVKVFASDSSSPDIVPKVVPNKVFILRTGVLDPPNIYTGSTTKFNIDATCPINFLPYMTITPYKVLGNAKNTAKSSYTETSAELMMGFSACIYSVTTQSNNTTQAVYLFSKFESQTRYPYWNHLKAYNEDKDEYNLYGLVHDVPNDPVDKHDTRVGATASTFVNGYTDYTTTNFGLQWVLYCYPPNIQPPTKPQSCDPSQIPYYFREVDAQGY